MNKTYPVKIGDITENLPVLKISDGMSIAFFNLHGNVALTERCAALLADRLEGKTFDVILTAESKGLQLAHCLARNLSHPFYAVARKSKKLYMQDGLSARVKSITTENMQTLYLSAHDAELIKGRRVALVDDVVSTGGSLSAMQSLVEQAGGEVAVNAAVLAEGAAAERRDLIYLAAIPVL
ncbi:MAG: adenine phosphoribosyltransferase [Clostridia bacterium]|nr:adenine phosphoribosyltransferase [Clostridia bacterium]